MVTFCVRKVEIKGQVGERWNHLAYNSLCTLALSFFNELGVRGIILKWV